jgi:hypothetical protein|tara:strand:+ start:3722 stop:3832 length:111 start_codon:yes stop_codon:yes gene_type:complete
MGIKIEKIEIKPQKASIIFNDNTVVELQRKIVSREH